MVGLIVVRVAEQAMSIAYLKGSKVKAPKKDEKSFLCKLKTQYAKVILKAFWAIQNKDKIP